MSTAKEEINELLRVAQGMSEGMMREAGGFQPFGLLITAEGELKVITPSERVREESSEQLITKLEDEFRDEAQQGLNRATAIVYDVRARFEEGAEVSEAIAVAADHREVYSVVVYFPYTKADDGLIFGKSLVYKGKDAIFAR